MPNYVQNFVKFSKKNSVDAMKKVYETCLFIWTPDGEVPYSVETDSRMTDNEGLKFDFNKLRPVPVELFHVDNCISGYDGEFLRIIYESLPKLVAEQILYAQSYYDKLFSGSTCENINHEADVILKFIGRKDFGAAHFILKEIKGAVKLLIKKGEWQPENSAINSMFVRIENFADEALDAETGSRVKETVSRRLRKQDKALLSIADLIERFAEDDIQKLMQCGELRLNNRIEYEYADWYEWCMKKWGTKWNSFETKADWTARTISFQTASSHPSSIVKLLTELFPDVDFTWYFADEDCGYNAGKYSFYNGCLKEYMADTGSEEAFALYAKCWGHA